MRGECTIHLRQKNICVSFKFIRKRGKEKEKGKGKGKERERVVGSEAPSDGGEERDAGGEEQEGQEGEEEGVGLGIQQ